jgi:F-type H+-transporting ATPase subunit epsilon
MSLQVHIVTPAKNMLSTACNDVVLPGFDGEMGILTEHAHLVNRLGAGLVKIHKDGETLNVAISGGVVEVGGNQVTILADEAMFAKDINTAKLDQEQKKLSEALVTLSDETTDREKLFAKQRWLTAQYNLIKS